MFSVGCRAIQSTETIGNSTKAAIAKDPADQRLGRPTRCKVPEVPVEEDIFGPVAGGAEADSGCG